MDEILVFLHNGRIVERGNYGELINAQGILPSWQMQCNMLDLRNEVI